MKSIKLFCFPYAGGAAAVYNKWKKYLDPGTELRPVEMAGRGQRLHEPHYNNVDEAVEDVFRLIRDEICQSPYSLFGHSMGSMIAHRVHARIRAGNLPGPLHVFFSGRQPPHVSREGKKKYHLMGEEEFKREIVGLGGTPPELFDHPDLMKIFLPLLKNDFKLSETDLPDARIHPLDSAITVFLGKEDTLTAEESDGWKRHSKQRCTIHYFEGGHFFLHDNTEEVVGLINHTLKHYRGDTPRTLTSNHVIR